jgi:hypothetical protein
MAEPKPPSLRKKQLLLGVVLLLALVAWLGHNISWKEKAIEVGQSAAARKDNFLAAKYFLHRQGLASETLRSFSLLDTLHWQGEKLGADDTLILINSYKLLQDTRLQNLLTWVEGGGTVIASTQSVFIGSNTNTRDQLLDTLGVEVLREPATADEPAEEIEDENTIDDAASMDGSDEVNDQTNGLANDESNEETNEEPKEPRACETEASLIALPFADEATPLMIDYSAAPRFASSSLPQLAAGDELGLYIAQFNVGQGRIIVNSDLSLWNNSRIECHDHAYLLWKAVNPHGKVWFLVNQEAPSLLTLIVRTSPAGALAGAVALLLWLWANAARFGPIRSRSEHGRRSLAEHIRASAMLLWRRGQHPYLVTQLRTRLRERLQRMHPHFNNLTEPDQISHLQTLCTLSPEAIHQALFSDQLQSPQDFTEAVANLQILLQSSCKT